jgi:SAM-dependent methyltransferase
MHVTSRLKMEAFLAVYGVKGKKILDIGSRGARGPKEYTYKVSAQNWDLDYTGLDFEQGRNVDVVPQNPYIWDELETDRFDYVISGQAFEHNPFMWITFCEIARVLAPGGLTFIIAPSAGLVHRFPYDCWRYYPDSWGALCALTGLEVVETLREDLKTKGVPGAGWLDAGVIARKPTFETPEASEAFYANLAEITAPFRARRYDFQPPALNEGQCYTEYKKRLSRWFERAESQKTRAAMASASPAAPTAPKLGGKVAPGAPRETIAKPA